MKKINKFGQISHEEPTGQAVTEVIENETPTGGNSTSGDGTKFQNIAGGIATIFDGIGGALSDTLGLFVPKPDNVTVNNYTEEKKSPLPWIIAGVVVLVVVLVLVLRKK